MNEHIVGAVHTLLSGHLGDELEAAFIYGSVAAGTAGPRSDLDCFVLTRGELSAGRAERLQTAFADLQRDLGFTPDPIYPIEIFATTLAVAALDEPLLLRALTTAALDDHLDDMTLNSDCVEVLRALLNVRLPIDDSVVLDSLTVLARHRLVNAALRHHVPPAQIAARLGVKYQAEPIATIPAIGSVA